MLVAELTRQRSSSNQKEWLAQIPSSRSTPTKDLLLQPKESHLQCQRSLQRWNSRKTALRRKPPLEQSLQILQIKSNLTPHKTRLNWDRTQWQRTQASLRIQAIVVWPKMPLSEQACPVLIAANSCPIWAISSTTLASSSHRIRIVRWKPSTLWATQNARKFMMDCPNLLTHASNHRKLFAH